MKSPELLSPAGSLKRMRRAFAYGADAVYAGQPRYSLRARNNEFSHEKLVLGINEAHAQGKLFFVASNIIAQNNKINTYLDDLAPVIEAGPDALIMADPGLIMMVREKWPDQPVHLSVQSNVMNYAAVKFWQTMGLERVILSRELSLKEIQAIREYCPDIELEVFVHGALCMAHSGRCLLSGYFNHRDPNQGACTNACRWNYEVKEGTEDEWGNARIETRTALFEQAPQREGEMNIMEEDEHGTYLFNSKDLRAIQHIETLAQMGIDCLKIGNNGRLAQTQNPSTARYAMCCDRIQMSFSSAKCGIAKPSPQPSRRLKPAIWCSVHFIPSMRLPPLIVSSTSFPPTNRARSSHNFPTPWKPSSLSACSRKKMVVAASWLRKS